MTAANLKTGQIPKILVVIIDREEMKRLDELLAEKNAKNDIILNGVGTARSEILKAIGLSETKKTLCACLMPAAKARTVLYSIFERFGLSKPGRGIAFILSVSALSANIANNLAGDNTVSSGERADDMQKETNSTNSIKMELVLAIINQGFSDDLMDVARKAGAGGGTVLHARGTAHGLEEKFHGITLQDEKEVVAIIIAKDKRRGLMQALSEACGQGTPAHGVIMSVPVEQCVGLSSFDNTR